MGKTAIKIENLRKRYKLGAIGGTTLNAELQSWWARRKGKEDPNLKIGQSYETSGEIFWALDGVNLKVEEGEALGIIGRNGAGKSTLLKILSRVTAPTEGDIWINGRISSMLEVGTGFHGELTGRENIYMNGAILGMSKKEVDEKIESIIDFSECRQFIDTPVKRYSSGMYVKLAFAVASHLDAEILIMDEVLAVGDMAFQKKCLNKMDKQAKSGKTILYVSHNMATIRSLCNRCVVLDKGRIIFAGDVENAIAIYSGSQARECRKTKYIVSGMSRRAYLLGKIVEIKEIEFVNKEYASFLDEEEMVLKVKWKTNKSLSDLHFRIVFSTIDTTVIGMSESPTILQGNEEGEHVTMIKFLLKNLTEGSYTLKLSINGVNESGEYDMRDECPISIPFTINENAYITATHSRWIKSYWGSVRFDGLDIEEIKND